MCVRGRGFKRLQIVLAAGGRRISHVCAAYSAAAGTSLLFQTGSPRARRLFTCKQAQDDNSLTGFQSQDRRGLKEEDHARLVFWASASRAPWGAELDANLRAVCLALPAVSSSCLQSDTSR